MGLVGSFLAVHVTEVPEFWACLNFRGKVKNGAFSNSGNDSAENNQITLNAFNSLRRLLQVRTEKEMLEIVMQSGVELLLGDGASFVPYDEWGQSLPPLIYGNVFGDALQHWVQQLSLPETRQVCKNCKSFHGDINCVLISSSEKMFTKVNCFPFKSGGREVGVINIYYKNESGMRYFGNRIFLDILDAAGMALENLHSRDQELAALLFLQSSNSPKLDLSALLNKLLENIQRALDVGFAFLYLPDGIPGQFNSTPQFISGVRGEDNRENPMPSMAFFFGIWKSVIGVGQSLFLENVSISKNEEWKMLLAIPLVLPGEEPVGVLILGSNNIQKFNRPHQVLLETLAGQTALLIQDARLLLQVEYQAVVDERSRLAREIHDGLAQTLAFLKIQAAQMQNFLARGETDKLNNTLNANYRTLSDAYIDARQAIEDLRRVPTTNLREWIGQIASDFEQATDQKVNVSVAEFGKEYPVNIQTQLIRIVQEALSNIRKHASSTTVDIFGIVDRDSYFLEIRDNGRGFTPLNWNGDEKSRYGLRGMRERSESIGADFQIISQPGKGTCVSLRVPAEVKEEL